MAPKGKLAKSEKFLLAAGAAFLCVLAALFLYDRSATRGSYTVETTRAATSEEVVPPMRTVNINTATAAELEALPGIGVTLAERIVEDREANGPFASPEEIQRVNGIGEGIYAEIAPQITVDGEGNG